MSDLGLFIVGANERNLPVEVPFTGPDPRFAAPYLAYSDLGRDMNGKPLVTERHAWLDREGIVEDGVREFYLAMWRALDAERDLVSEERDDDEKAKRKQQQG